MSKSRTFANAITACLCYGDTKQQVSDVSKLEEQVQRVLGESSNSLKDQPTRQELENYLSDIRKVLPEAVDRIALVSGGATKIKGYVFEASKLPEIRGASALLDWINEVALNHLWYDKFGPADADRSELHPYIIYASGGNFLAFAPADLGQEMATAIEQCYTEHTLTANSVAVSATFRLLELRYGRLSIENNRISYWIDEFLEHWKDLKLQRQLASYYYGAGSDTTSVIQRFYNRKTFGELVTFLATMNNRRRDERAYHGQARNVPLYELLPWAERCDSSDIRPAVIRTPVGDNLEPRELSEASARKRFVGRIVKIRKAERAKDLKWFTDRFGNEWANRIRDLDQRSWEQRWLEFLENDGKASRYAESLANLPNSSLWPAQDVGEIAQASSPSRYIGTIYADGNNVGRLIATLKTPAAYAETSNILRDAASHAVFQALAKHLRPTYVRTDAGVQRWVHPFEIITIGGDDLLLMVPGSASCDIAATIGYTFESTIAHQLTNVMPAGALSSSVVKGRYAAATYCTEHSYTPTLGLSAGVIIAHEYTPIFFLHDLVEKLLKNAKEKAKQQASQNFYSGAVDFMVMTSLAMVTDSIQSFRQTVGETKDHAIVRHLYAKPYSWHEFDGLRDTIKNLKKVGMPRSQLYRLRQVLNDTNIVTSVLEYLYTRARLPESLQEALILYVEKNWGNTIQIRGVHGGLPPWISLDTQMSQWETFWPDMLEAYEMVPQED